MVTAENDRRGLCPDGWRVPSDDDWDELVNYLGESSVAGGKLKSRQGWRSPNTGATNESGFSGLPSGARFINGYNFIGFYGYWWSSTEFNNGNAWCRLLDLYYGGVFRGFNYKPYGFSVRCLRD